MGVGRSRREKSVQRAENGPIKATRLLRQPHREVKIAPGGLAGNTEKKEEKAGGGGGEHRSPKSRCFLATPGGVAPPTQTWVLDSACYLGCPCLILSPCQVTSCHLEAALKATRPLRGPFQGLRSHPTPLSCSASCCS